MQMKIIALGALGYVSLYGIHSLFLSATAGDASHGDAELYRTAFELMGYLTWFLPGYFIGRSASRKGVMHGASAGALGALVCMLLVFVVFREANFARLFSSFGALYWLAKAAFFCGLAAALGELHARNKREAL